MATPNNQVYPAWKIGYRGGFGSENHAFAHTHEPFLVAGVLVCVWVCRVCVTLCVRAARQPEVGRSAAIMHYGAVTIPTCKLCVARRAAHYTQLE